MQFLSQSQIEWARARDNSSLHWLSNIIISLFRYKKLRNILYRIALRLEGGRFFFKNNT